MAAAEEAERLANEPPPPILAARYDLRFNNTKFNHALLVDDDGIKVTSEVITTGMLILTEPCNPEPYTIDDFPEDADDIPGTFDPYVSEAGEDPGGEPKPEEEKGESKPEVLLEIDSAAEGGKKEVPGALPKQDKDKVKEKEKEKKDDAKPKKDAKVVTAAKAPVTSQMLESKLKAVADKFKKDKYKKPEPQDNEGGEAEGAFDSDDASSEAASEYEGGDGADAAKDEKEAKKAEKEKKKQEKEEKRLAKEAKKAEKE